VSVMFSILLNILPCVCSNEIGVYFSTILCVLCCVFCLFCFCFVQEITCACLYEYGKYSADRMFGYMFNL
jgi:hypothetical protein